jgi:hypothetical protein
VQGGVSNDPPCALSNCRASAFDRLRSFAKRPQPTRRARSGRHLHRTNRPDSLGQFSQSCSPPFRIIPRSFSWPTRLQVSPSRWSRFP